MATTSCVELSALHSVEQKVIHDDEGRHLSETYLRESQRQIYVKYRDRVYRLMFHMVGSFYADDLTQQVFMRVFQNLDKFQRRSSFSTWLFRVASNEALQFLRRNHREWQLPSPWECTDKRSSATDQVDNQELLEYALSRLDPQLRAVFLLREIEGLVYYDIAMALDIAEGTVASRLNRARRCLRELIEVASK